MKYLIAAVLCVPLSGCTLFKTLTSSDPVAQVEAMSDSEFIAWRETVIEEIAIVAETAYGEGVLSQDDLNAAASVLMVIAGENQVEAGQLAEWISASGYLKGLLKLAMLELNSDLVAGGAYVDGLLGERGRDLLLRLGARLAEIAPQ